MDTGLTSVRAGPVPVYDLSTGEQSSVDGLTAAYAWSDKQAICFALTKLQGVAKTWYDRLLTIQLT